MAFQDFMFEFAMVMVSITCVVWIQKQILQMILWYVRETTKKE